jgi:DNA-binding IclR family transcriptional regulator
VTKGAPFARRDAVPGICCISAPVWWPNGACAAAITVSVHANNPPVALPNLVSGIASRIGAALAQLTPKC